MAKTNYTVRKVLQLNEELKAANVEKDLGFVAKFKLNSIQKGLQNHLENFNKTRIELINKFGVDGEKGKTLEGSENAAKGYEELGKLLDTKVSVNLNSSLTLDDFKDLKTDKPYDLLYTLVQEV